MKFILEKKKTVENMVQTHCSVFADMLTHCYRILSKLSSSFLNAAGLKKAINREVTAFFIHLYVCLGFYIFSLFLLFSHM